jgi:hypothetical protein
MACCFKAEESSSSAKRCGRANGSWRRKVLKCGYVKKHKLVRDVRRIAWTLADGRMHLLSGLRRKKIVKRDFASCKHKTLSIQRFKSSAAFCGTRFVDSDVLQCLCPKANWEEDRRERHLAGQNKVPPRANGSQNGTRFSFWSNVLRYSFRRGHSLKDCANLSDCKVVGGI